jgi:hypothetical protein
MTWTKSILYFSQRQEMTDFRTGKHVDLVRAYVEGKTRQDAFEQALSTARDCGKRKKAGRQTP